DAYGAFAYLGSRRDVLAGRIGLQGWSNGASAVLATMAMPRAPNQFRVAVAFYPGCALKGQFEEGMRPYAPVRVLQGDADEEVSPRRCVGLVDRSRARGGDIEIVVYPGATHDFDDPGQARQAIAPNVRAKADAMTRVYRCLQPHQRHRSPIIARRFGP